METRANPTQAWRFGVFEVDVRALELRRGGAPVKLREQSFRILVLLLEHPGELVTREELRRVLWPSDTFVDFDHSLNTAVMKLREALGDSAEKPLYIETIPKRGYRFITLEEALSDPVYSLPDTYVGEEGTGWIDHWAITQGKILKGAPVFPQWVLDRSRELHLSTGQVSAETQN